MSSYLVFYLKPKNSETPLEFLSFSRSSDIYQAFNNEINIAYRGDENTNFTELTPDKMSDVISSASESLQLAKNSLADFKEAFSVSPKIDVGMIEEFSHRCREKEEYIAELEENLNNLQFISKMVDSIKYSDFEKVLINVG